MSLLWGLPNADRWYPYHPDEYDVAKAVYQLDFLGGQFNPHFFNYPSLFLYLTYIIHGAMGLFGLTLSPPQEWSVLREIILAGRLVSMFLGAATASLVYLLGREWQMREPGQKENFYKDNALIAAIFLIVMPGHIQHSQFATVDVSTTFFITACLLFATRALRGGKNAKWVRKQLLLSAIMAGLATATKYNAILVLAAPLLSACLCEAQDSVERKRLLRMLPVLPVVSAVAFLLACPSAVFNFNEFWGEGKLNGLSYELLVHPRLGSGDVFTNTGNGWWYHLSLNLPFALTTPVLIISLIGLALVLFDLIYKHEKIYAPVVLFGFLYFFSLGFSQVRFMRYVIPLMPVLALGVQQLFSRLTYGTPRESNPFAAKRAGWATVAFCIIIGFTANLPTASESSDARNRAATWLHSQGATSAAPISIGLMDNPWFFTPPFVKQDTPPGSPPDAVQTVLASNPNYKLSVLGLDAQKLTQERPEYVVMNDFEWRDKLRLKDAQFLEFFKTLKENYKLVQCFGRHAGPTLAGEPGADELVTTEPHDFIYTNPQVRIYERRN